MLMFLICSCLHLRKTTDISPRDDIYIFPSIDISSILKNEQIINDSTSDISKDIIPENLVDSYISNNTIGHIYHSGGIITFQDNGSQSRSKSIEISSNNEYYLKIQSVINSVSYKSDFIKKIEATTNYPILFYKDKIRGSVETENITNLNLPMYSFKPIINPNSEIWDTVQENQLLAFPIIVSYYTHNSGWFIGHEYGCEAGARIEVALYVFNSNGEIIDEYHIKNSKLIEGVYQPNSTDLEDILIYLEKKTTGDIYKIISKL